MSAPVFHGLVAAAAGGLLAAILPGGPPSGPPGGPSVPTDPPLAVSDPADPLPWLDRYRAIGALRRPRFSHDGSRVFFLSRVAGSDQVFAVPREGGEQRQVTFFPGTLVDFEAAPDRDELVVAVDAVRDGGIQLFRLSTDGMRVEPLIVDPAASHTLGPWSPDGRRLSYQVRGSGQPGTEVRVLDLGNGAVHTVAQGPGAVEPLGFSPDGLRLLVRRPGEGGGHTLESTQVSTGAAVRLLPQRRAVQVLGAAFTTGSTRAVVLAGEGTDPARALRIDLDPRDRPRMRGVDPPGSARSALALAPDGRTLALVSLADGGSRLEFRDLQGAPPPGPPQLPAGVLEDLEWSPDGRWLALRASGPTRPSELWLVDTLSSESRLLLAPQRAGVPESALVTPRAVRWVDAGGRNQEGLLYLPLRRVCPCPTQVRVERAGPRGPRAGFDAVAQAWVRRGYAVFRWSDPGPPPSDRRRSPGRRSRPPGTAGDRLVAAGRWLVEQGHADPRRLAALALGDGGGIVLDAMSIPGQPFQAAVAVAESANPPREPGPASAVVLPTLVIERGAGGIEGLLSAERLVAGLRARGVAVRYLRIGPTALHGGRIDPDGAAEAEAGAFLAAVFGDP